MKQVLLLLDRRELLKVPIVNTELLLSIVDDAFRRVAVVPWEVEHEVLYDDCGGDIELVPLAFITIRRVLLRLVLLVVASLSIVALHERSLRVLSEKKLGHVDLLLWRLHMGMHLRGWDRRILDLKARIQQSLSLQRVHEVLLVLSDLVVGVKVPAALVLCRL